MHVSDNKCYSWKPIIVKAASQHAEKLIVWQDSSVRWFRESFLDSLDRAYAAGHQVLRHFKSHRIPANTLKEQNILAGLCDWRQSNSTKRLKDLCKIVQKMCQAFERLVILKRLIKWGQGNGGYGIYILWPDGKISRICGLCVRFVIRGKQKGAALLGVVIFTDCRALVQTLGGSDREDVGKTVLLADQWQSSYSGVIGNEIANGLANEGRTQPQPREPSTLLGVRPSTIQLISYYRVSSMRRIRRGGFACLVRMPEIGQCPPLGMGCHDCGNKPVARLPLTFDYIHEDACGYLPYPEIQGNVHIHRADEFNRRVVFEPWARCALEKQCICPRRPNTVISCKSGTLHRCHRFDQSTMGIFLSRLYQEDLWKIQFKELAFNKGKEFRVLRGDSKRSYFIG
ncbi:hypothetical protein PoB_004820300 [Plakobranchus ocellatus]|uniref:RNase H type-1 domain-containing protein n=1 Tax=Plakobranchus ocellatus TaxID=259542 RepID=A0AAV4BQ42_9GAST|nr:hypothetical protein PoB_004820300 [Plakobranchus ocellatus]